MVVFSNTFHFGHKPSDAEWLSSDPQDPPRPCQRPRSPTRRFPKRRRCGAKLGPFRFKMDGKRVKQLVYIWMAMAQNSCSLYKRASAPHIHFYLKINYNYWVDDFEAFPSFHFISFHGSQREVSCHF